MSSPANGSMASYFVAPSPFTSNATRLPGSGGRSANSPSTRTSATSLAVPGGSPDTPGSPWMPGPTAIRPTGEWVTQQARNLLMNLEGSR